MRFTRPGTATTCTSVSCMNEFRTAAVNAASDSIACRRLRAAERRRRGRLHSGVRNGRYWWHEPAPDLVGDGQALVGGAPVRQVAGLVPRAVVARVARGAR